MRDQPCTGSNRLDFHSVSETLTWNTAAGWWWPVESLRAILPFRKSFERAQQPWNTGSAVSINRLMKWLGRKKENRWKKEREKEEEKRTQKWRKSKRSEQTFQRFRADTGKLASSELTSFEFPNGPNTRRERERKGNEKNVSMLVYACRMERDAGWGKRKSSARYFNEGSLEHRGRSFILRVRQLFWCWKLRNCWFRRSMRVGEGRGGGGGGEEGMAVEKVGKK